MKKYRCIKKCFFGGRLWAVGEIMSLPEGSQANKFFVESGASLSPRKDTQVEPNTFSEFQKIETQGTLETLKMTVEDKDDFLK